MKKILLENKVFAIIFSLSLLSVLRSLVIPIWGDEITYSNIANNILEGRYYQVNNPSTVSPIIPFILAFFKTEAFPMFGLALSKLLNIGLVLLGFRYLYLFLKKQNLDDRVILSIMALTAANPIGIYYFGSLYPEAILFFSFWGFIYYSNQEYKTSNFIKMFGLFLLLAMTRYLYIVMGLIVVFNFYKFYKANSLKDTYKLITYAIILILPVVLWAKYVYNIEHKNLSEISYFNRFKADNPLLYNLKAGLGIIKHADAEKVNGIPAFVSLFVPITGFRNYLGSVILILAFVYGYIRNSNTVAIKTLILAISLTMVGLIFSGTGFSRYWLILLPGFFLGYYFLARKFKIKDKWFVYASQIVCFIYIANEIRLDLLILNRHL